MNSRKVENNIESFEKNISNVIILLLSAFVITTALSAIISYQSYLQQKSLKSKDIYTAISLFQNNISEKLSIIASSNVFIDFFTSGISTREDLESRFLTELLPLRSSGIIGYSLSNLETGTNYQSGDKSDQSLTVKLCYLANRLDSENGSCHGKLQLFFSRVIIAKELNRINSSIKACKSCSKQDLTKDGYFGNFLVDSQSKFDINITADIENDNLVYFYITIILILFCFYLFNRNKLRKIIQETISTPIDLLINQIKSQEPLIQNPDALYEINYLSSQIEAGRVQISKINEYEKNAALGYLAAGVAHDIRSPLSVMEIITLKISTIIPESQLIILNRAVQSVRDIANNLLEHHRLSSDSNNSSVINSSNPFEILQEDENIARPVLLSSLLELIISQKTYEWHENLFNLKTDICSYTKSAWVHASPNDIKRVISNLLNNSYDAITEINLGIIHVMLNTIGNELYLQIKDNGIGIPTDKITDVLNGTSLKHPGKGLGLSSAKRYMENLTGKLQIKSIVGSGTEITLIFPCIDTPLWLPKKILLDDKKFILILDDDFSMLMYWKQRITRIGLIPILCSSYDEALNWVQSNNELVSSTIFLADYELTDNLNGLMFLEQINSGNNRYLVTSHAEELRCQQAAEKAGVHLIPKSLVDEILFG